MNALPLIVLFALLAASTPAQALHHEAPASAKLGTDDAWTVGRANLESEFGYGWSGESSPARDFGLGFKYGVTDRLDAAVWAVGISESGETSGEIGGGIKWMFLERERFSMAAAVGLAGPTNGPNEEEPLNLEGLAIASHWFGRHSLSADIGYALPVAPGRTNGRGAVVADVALGLQVNDWMQPVVEINYERELAERARESADVLHGTVGLVLTPLTWMRLDLGAQRALYARNADAATRFMVRVTVAH